MADQNGAPNSLAGLGVPATAVAPASTNAPAAKNSLASLGVPATPAASSTSDSAAAPETSTLAKVGHAAQAVADFVPNVETGFVKGVGDTVSGISHLINKIPGVGETLSPAQGTAALDQMDKSSGVSQSIGKGAEGIAEFMAGDEALSGLARATKFVELSEKYPLVAKTLQLAKDHPWFAKMIAEVPKAAAVGGVQGAVKGAVDDNAVGGAEAGALGGAVGGAIGGTVDAVKASRDPVVALTKAVKPTGNLINDFAAKAKLALPKLMEENASTPITNLDELSDAAHKAAKNLWENEIMPQIAKHGAEIIPGAPVAAAIRGEVLAGDTDLFPSTAEAAEEFAKKFDGDMTLQSASDRLQSLNRKLQGLYKLDPASRYAATANSPAVEAMENGANELRAQIYSKLDSLGETGAAEQRQTYGALKTVERAAEKRTGVENRLAPINLTQQLAGAAAALHIGARLAVGDVPGAVAGAAPILAAKASKVINSSGYQIPRAVAPAVEAGARPVAKALANAGSQTVQDVEDQLRRKSEESTEGEEQQ